MKEILLALASLFVVASYASAQTEDSSTATSTGTTIYEYDFNKFPSGPVAYEYYSKPTMNTSIIGLTTSDIKTDENDKSWITIENYSDDYGLIAESSNGTFRYGLSVVDLGDAGKALCLNGVSSGLSNYLGINLPALPTCNPFHGLSFSFGNKTESLAGKKLRLEATYAIYQASEASGTRLNNFYVRAKSGDLVSLSGGSYSNLNVIADPEASYKANAGKLEKWVTVTHDFEVASSGSFGGPFYLEMKINNSGTINDKSLLIKSVKLSEIKDIDSNNANGNVTTSDFGTVKAVASENWNVERKDTDGFVVSYPHAYCNETLEYALKVVNTTTASSAADLKAVTDDGLTYVAVSSATDYFTVGEDGDVTVNTSAIKSATGLTETGTGDVKKIVVFFQVKAGSNQVVVTKSVDNRFAIDATSDVVTGVADVIADDEAPVYYNLSGVRIAKPTAPGLYIRRQGAKATKVVIK
jgi:hypothetical protein